MTKIDKWSILAGVRFILASIVAIDHLADYTSLGWLSFVPLFGAFEAVFGFLLISGYSISISYAKQPQGFLLRRLYRLYPIYLAAMACTYVAFVLLKVRPPSVIYLAFNALFMNQLFTDVSFVGPAWSLSLEFWLYCLAPLMMGLPMKRVRAIIWGSFASFVVYTILRTLLHLPYYSGLGYGGNLLFLAFVWLAGLRLARAKGDATAAMRDIGIIFGCHIALMVAIQIASRLKHHEICAFFRDDLIVYIMEAATLFFVYWVFKTLVVPERPALHRSRFLRWIGDISYPLYLLHAAVYGIIGSYFGFKNPVLLYLAAVIFSALVYWSLDFYSRKRHQQIGTT
jgi:peptidoglycan/LPS O-acetylase OafA/YrhL